MATESVIYKLNKGTTAVMNAVTGPLDGEPFINTTTATIWYFDTATGLWINTGTTSGSVETHGHTTAAVSAVGSTNFTLAALDLRKKLTVTVTGGAGIFTHAIVLQTTNATAGDVAVIALRLPASTNPTIEIRNATAGGTLLDSVHDISGSAALYWLGTYTFTGSAWEKDLSGFQV